MRRPRRNHSWRPALRWIAATIGLLALHARPARAQSALDGVLHLDIERYQLANGLEVILHEDHTVPLVHINLRYHVGGADDPAMQSGLAHLCEHMMFQGSEHVPAGEHVRVLSLAGSADGNANTTFDGTEYIETVPPEQLETVLWLESDRMAYLVPALDPERFENQRAVVRNERRQRFDNVPFTPERAAIARALYPEGHPYLDMVIGRPEDLERLTLADAARFFERWYGPGNATLVLAGDFDPAQAKALVAKWFATLPGRPRPSHAAFSPTRLTSPRRQVVSDRFAQLRRVHYVWPLPANAIEHLAPLRLLTQLLQGDPYGLLLSWLVVQQKLAQNLSVGANINLQSGEFHVSMDVRPDADLDALEAALRAELVRVGTQPADDRRFGQAMASILASSVVTLEPLNARASGLQSYGELRGDPDSLAWFLASLHQATPETVRALAAQTLGAGRVELITMPEEP